MIAACDAYEAMTTDRSYRARRDPEEAVAELRREAGFQFDPHVVELLLQELATVPPGDALHAAHDAREQAAREAGSYLRAALERSERDPSAASATKA